MIWSFSFLKTLDVCPHQAWHRYILKDVPMPKTKEIEEGNAAHKALEKRLQGVPLEPKHAHWEGLAEPLIQMKAKAEVKLGITMDGKPAGFFDKNVWGRGVLDAHVIRGEYAFLGDWKTGKRREDPFELEAQAVLLKAKHPYLKKITGHYIWLKDNRVGQAHDVSNTAATWESICHRMRTVETYTIRGDFPKTEGPLCGWCPVESCENWRPRPE